MREQADIRRTVEQAVRQTLSAGLPSDMTLSLARTLIAAVEQQAAHMGVNAVAAVADRAARPVAMERMDDAFVASFDIAMGKAYTSAALKMSTAELKTLSQPGGALYGVQHTNGGHIVIFGGGVPLLCGGRVIGALGVSGGTEEQDTALAAFGAEVFDRIMKQLRKG